MSAGQS